MSDENRTRIITPNTNKSAPDNANVTRVLGGGGSSQSTGKQADTGPRTRMMSAPVADVAEDGASAQLHELTAGWLAIVEGPGRGCTREIFYGMNSIGRGTSERIPLDFGDTSISREAHAYVVFDEKQSDFYIQHGGKSNLVRLNGAPVLAPQSLNKGDIVEIGDTKLMFVPLCDDGFKWEDQSN